MTDPFLTCPSCGKQVNKRDPGQVLSHGIWNEELERYECLDGELRIPAKTSKRKGEPVEWHGIYEIFLN